MSSSRVSLPLVVTMGDPLGIGPEIILQAQLRGELQDAVVLGDEAVMRRAAAVLPAAAGLQISASTDWARLQAADSSALRLWQVPQCPSGLAELPWGTVQREAGAAAAASIRAAVQAVQAGRARAIVTAPLHKEALALAGVDFPGHTEMLQDACRQADGSLPPVRMMLANEQLRVVLVTIHVALRTAIAQLSTPLIFDTLRITHEAGLRFGMARPRIAVAGLNPHAGEGGLFGDEEIQLIEPAIAQARALGWDVRGPFAPDTVFMRARHAPGHPGEFDFVVAMTHDHGLIPVKYLGVEEGVNVTLGLPLVRTSPDHGTAFDLAGQGLADPASLCAALRMARRLTA